MSGLRPASRATDVTPGKWSGDAHPRLRQAAGYLYAVVLPWMASYISFHTPALNGMRMALNFASVAAAATFFGGWTAVVAVVVSAAAYNHYAIAILTRHSTPGEIAIRTAVILVAAGTIAQLIRHSFQAERKLRTALLRLQEQSEALAQAQQASGSAAWSFDAATRVTRWYPGGAEIFGRPHEEITAMGSPTSLVLEEDRPAIAAAAERTIQTGLPFNVEFRVSTPDGSLRWLEARGTPLSWNTTCWRGATIDITDRKRAEEALLRTEKLAIAGRLAASIAHEINNPLEAVTNLCYLAKRVTQEEETRGYIELAEAELSRVAQIASQTLRFHRQQTAAAATDVEEVLRSILALYDHRMRQAAVTVRLEAQPAPPLVCFAGEIRQVLANLAGNAVDAMKSGGVLRIRLRTITDGQTGLPAVRVTIADDGHGMSVETQRRIYEPFYTTKGDVGTGLGLWVTAGIVEKHQGRLRLRSSTREGQSGTVFSLLLPYGVL